MTALGLLAGVALDQVVPDPRRGHPVAVFGTVAGRLEQAMWRDDRGRGVAYTACLVGSVVLLGIGASRVTGLKLAAATAAGTWAVLGGNSLAAEASAVDDLLRRGDLAAARQRLTHLVGRRTQHLDEGEIARAVIESVAENSSDAVVAPLFWGAVAGLPGLLAYRAVNTLDAMVGHRSPRYERFGWAAARADDVANYVPARLTALLAAALAPLAGGSGRAALAVWRADGSKHPSPNAGVCESAYAGALGLRLGGRNDYGSRTEDRPVLGGGVYGKRGGVYGKRAGFYGKRAGVYGKHGEAHGKPGRPAAVGDISRAIGLSRGVTIAAALACAAIAAISLPIAAISRRAR